MTDAIGEALRLAVRNGQSRLYFAAPLGGCCDQADRASLVTELKRYRVGLAAHEAGGSPPRFEECGCCGHRHRPEFSGDCRDDSERFADAELDAFCGAAGWTPVDLDEVTHSGKVDLVERIRKLRD